MLPSASSRAGQPRISLRSTFVILAAAAAGMGALLAYLPAAGHDQLWLLYVADHVRGGARLYGTTLLESNPPLIVWLSLLPVELGHLLHLPAAAMGKALVALLQIAVAAVSLPLLRRAVPVLSRAQLASLLFAFITIFNVLPARDLGQRDFLLALLCLPYLLAAAARLVGKPANAPFSALIGLAAGMGLALKPHQAGVPLAVEALLILRSRSLRPLLRPEPLAIMAVAAAYLAAICRFTPLYVTDVLPLLRDTYWAVGGLSVPALLWQAIELHLLAAAAIGLFVRRKQASPASAVLLTAGCAATLAYYLQGTGWYYQQLPAICFFACALVLQCLPTADRPVPRWSPRAAFALAALALLLTTHFMHYPFTPDRSFAIGTPDPAFFENLAPETLVATITTSVDDTVMPAARYNLQIAQRYPHLWLLPAILRNEQPSLGHPPHHAIPPARLKQLDDLQHADMVEDLTRWRPALVLVERCADPAIHCQLLEDRHDDLLAWFHRDPRFAEIWDNYEYRGSLGPYDAYVLKLGDRVD